MSENRNGRECHHGQEDWSVRAEKRFVLARVVGDAERAEDGLGRVRPGEVDGGGDDGGDGSDEAVHLRRLGPVVAGGEGGGPRRLVPVAVGAAVADQADRLPGAAHHQRRRRRRRRPLHRLPRPLIHLGYSQASSEAHTVVLRGPRPS